MNKKERQSALNKILYDSYRERFLNFKLKVKSEIVSMIPERFTELYSNEDDRKYLSKHTVSCVIFIDSDDKNTFCQPDFNFCYGFKPSGHIYRSSQEQGYEKIRFYDLSVPGSMDTVIINNADLWEEYSELWNKYIEALRQVESLLYSYKSRDKFAAEFPEFAKYLPPKVTIDKLPAIQVDVVRNKLASVGIPANGVTS